MKTINNVYLYGIGGVYNYGCEAMVRSISKQLKEVIPHCNVKYISKNYEDDVKRLSDCSEVDIVKANNAHGRYYKYNVITRGLKLIRRILQYERDIDNISITTEWVGSCDLLIVIGGDVFDLLPLKYRTAKYRNERIAVSNLVKKSGGDVILWGISIGDFDEDLVAKQVLLHYLNNTMNHGFIRDKKSFDYLKRNDVKNIELCTDPAFALRTLQTSSERKKIIGFNLSPLANRYLSSNNDCDEWIQKWSKVIHSVACKLGYEEIMLIPHVVNESYPRDDDFLYLKRVKETLDKMGCNCELISGNLGFLSVKKYLVKCDIILSARMHCAVNAVTCGVPTIFLSYSPKSIGMCKHVYGDNMNMVVKMEDLLNGKFSNLVDISKRTNEIRDYLANRNIELMLDAESPKRWLQEQYVE